MFFKKSKPANIKKEFHATIDIYGKPMAVKIKKLKNAKRITMRIVKGGICLSIPYYVSYKSAIATIPKYSDWIEKRLSNQGSTVFLTQQPFITVLDDLINIGYTNIPMRPKFKLVDNNLMISSSSDDEKSEVLKKFIKQYAKKFVEHKLQDYLPLINKSVNRIFIKDTKTRWGTCSSSGNISISWRLVFAPRFVMEYIIAHESAHLVHFNHSKDFWNLVENLDEDYKSAKSWLKENGNSLHNIQV